MPKQTPIKETKVKKEHTPQRVKNKSKGKAKSEVKTETSSSGPALAVKAVSLKARLDDLNIQKRALREALNELQRVMRAREEAERAAREEAERAAREEAESSADEEADAEEAPSLFGTVTRLLLPYLPYGAPALPPRPLVDEEAVSEPTPFFDGWDAKVEIVNVKARTGRPAACFEGLVALRKSPEAFFALEAVLSPTCRLESTTEDAALEPLIVFGQGLVSSARVASVTVTVDHASRDRDVEIDDDADLGAQTAAVVREMRELNKDLGAVKVALRAFQGQRFVVDGGKVSIGRSKEAVYGPTIGVDRALWGALDRGRQDACLEAGVVALTHAAAASQRLTVRDIGSAPPKRKRKQSCAQLTAVVRAKRGCTSYK